MTEPEDRTESPLWMLCPPYRDLLPMKHLDALEAQPRLTRGTAVVWQLRAGQWGRSFRMVRDRPAGVALIMILPPAESLDSVARLLDAAEQCRPHSVLPHHPNPTPGDLTTTLRRVPEDLPTEFMDYLTWRGLGVDQDTRRIVRKIVDLSVELKSVTGVARALYMSRRTLGRRFRKRGLPVPSHVLHFARLLRASLALQTSSRTLFEIGCELGYPDGFSLSNQMVRLTGLRPRTARERLGWEWIVEAWLQEEASQGSIALRPHPKGSARPEPARSPSLADDRPSVWRRAKRVAEKRRG